MKTKIIILFSFILLVLTSCGGNSSQNNTHTHEDGTVHEGNEHHQSEVPQESFKVNCPTETDSPSDCDHSEHEH